MAKRNYSSKLRNKLSSSDSASVWKGLKDITNYKTPSPSTLENQQLADNFNDFYSRFGKTPHARPKHLSTQPLTINTSSNPLSPLKISEDDVRKFFRENIRRKAPGPESVSLAWLKIAKIFNRLLELCEVPSTLTRPRSWWWISGDRAEKTHPSPSTRQDTCGAFTFWKSFVCIDICGHDCRWW